MGNAVLRSSENLHLESNPPAVTLSSRARTINLTYVSHMTSQASQGELRIELLLILDLRDQMRSIRLFWLAIFVKAMLRTQVMTVLTTFTSLVYLLARIQMIQTTSHSGSNHLCLLHGAHVECVP